MTSKDTLTSVARRSDCEPDCGGCCDQASPVLSDPVKLTACRGEEFAAPGCSNISSLEASSDDADPVRKPNIGVDYTSCCDSLPTSCCNTSTGPCSTSAAAAAAEPLKEVPADVENTGKVMNDPPAKFECASLSTGCCTTSDGPCCTENCVLEYAKYDCAVSAHESSSTGGSDGSPCSYHLESAMAKYGTMLRQAICLCRNVSSSYIVRCCDRSSPKTSVRQRRPLSSKPSITRSARSSLEPKSESKGCCDISCCRSKSDEEPETFVECRSKLPSEDVIKKESKLIFPRCETVSVNVQGMTCTGCEAKLERVLQSFPGVSEVSIIFVNGTASFKLDTELTNYETMIHQAQDKTGFKLTRIHEDLQSVDLLLTKISAKELAHQPPTGVTNVEILSKNAVRLLFDPKNVAVRPLLARLEDVARLAPVDRNSDVNKEKNHLYQMAIKTLLAASGTIPVCVLAWATTSLYVQTKAIVSLILATFVQIIAISEFYLKAFKAVIYSGSLELDMLVVISITAAYVYSVVAFGFLMAGEPLEIAEFFETSTLLITLVLLGRLLASFARAKAVASVSMRSLQETIVTIVGEDGLEQDIDARTLQFGDIFRVAAHCRIPTDGIILEGLSEVDESMLTGESAPVIKSPESKIIAGTLNGQGVLKAKVERLPGKNTIAQIASMVEAAQASKPKIQALADRVASYFIPVVLGIALMVFITWVPISLLVENRSGADAVVTATSYTIAALAVSCPCAIALAVPLVLLITGGIAARRGVVIKSAVATEQACTTTDVVFDKTGTLTSGELKVSHCEVLTTDQEEALAITLAITKSSNHPVSVGVATYVNECSPVPKMQLSDLRSIPGYGVEAQLEKVVLRAGNLDWLKVRNNPTVQKLLAEDLTLLCVTANDDLLAVFGLQSTMRSESASVVRELHQRGLQTHLLSGDVEQTVVQAAKSLGITNVRSCQSPADKCSYIENLASDPKRRILYCGDGTNDAVAVARADIGVAMGNTSDVTASSADVTLLGGLDGIIHLLDLSKAARRRVVFNFAWSALYNVFAILLASGAFVKFRLPPAYAGLGELVSVLPVVFAAATLYLFGSWK